MHLVFTKFIILLTKYHVHYVYTIQGNCLNGRHSILQNTFKFVHQILQYFTSQLGLALDAIKN